MTMCANELSTMFHCQSILYYAGETNTTSKIPGAFDLVGVFSDTGTVLGSTIDRVSHSFLEWMVPMAWQLTVLVVILLLLTWLLSSRTSARLRYALWLMVPIRLLLPPTLALVTGWGWWVLPAQNTAWRDARSWRTVSEPLTADLDLPPTRTAMDISSQIEPHIHAEFLSRRQNQSSFQGDLVSGIREQQTGMQVVEPPISREALTVSAIDYDLNSSTAKDSWVSSVPSMVQRMQRMGHSISSLGASWTGLMVAAWIAGMVLLFSRLIHGMLQVRRLLKGSVEADEEIQVLAQQCQELSGFRGTVSIRTSQDVSCPMLVGLLWRTVLLPADIKTNLSVEELKAVLVHEFQHVQRQDIPVNLIATLLTYVYWFHPAVWIAQWQLRRLRELACDEATVACLTNSRKAYATGLLKVASLIHQHRPLLTLGFAERQDEMVIRVSKILDSRLRFGRRLSLSSILLVVATALFLLPSAGRPGGLDVTESNVPIEIAPNAIGSRSEAWNHLDPVESTPTVANHQEPPIQQENSSAQQVEEKSDLAEGQQDQLSELLIKVVEESGQPIPGVKVRANYSTRHPANKNTGSVDHLTNEQGEVVLEMYPQFQSIYVWLSKDGFVPVNFHLSDQTNGDVSSEQVVTLQRGLEIGGTVSDASGRPVAGVKVNILRARGGTNIDRNSGLSAWLASGDHAAVSDRDGRWSIHNAPRGRDLELEFQLTHPDFVSDLKPRPMEDYGVTLRQLRNKSARFQLQRGTAISGRVVDDAGNPVNNAAVIWHHPLFHQEYGTPSMRTDADGKFRIPAQPPGKVQLYIVAPGCAPLLRWLNLATDQVENQVFPLTRSKKLHLRFVDPSGAPLQQIHVQLEEMNGVQPLFRFVHPSVLPSPLPDRCDDAGNFVWDWSPNEPFTLRVHAQQWKLTKQIRVAADGQVQTIVMRKPCVLSGDVMDAVTGEPINNYRVIPISYSTWGTATGVSAELYRAKRMHSSWFVVDDLARDRSDLAYALRFESPGYYDFTTEPFTLDTDDREMTVKLEPASLTQVRITDPNGQLSTAAKVWLVKLYEPLEMKGFDEFVEKRFHEGMAPNEHGVVQYVAPEARYAIVAIGREGYAEKYLDRDEAAGTLQLRPWARLEGQVFQEGQPVEGVLVLAEPIRRNTRDFPNISDSQTCVTDENGKFIFPRLAPLPTILTTNLETSRDTRGTSITWLPIDLKPGQTHKVSLGGAGLRVIGKVRLNGEEADKIQFMSSCNYLVRLEGGIEIPIHAREEHRSYEGDEKAWMERLAEGLYPNVHPEVHKFKLRDDGTFMVYGVAPGNYRLLFKIEETQESQSYALPTKVGYGYLEFSTDDFVAVRNHIDLGTIEIQLKHVLQEGDLLPDFEFQDMNGNPRRIAELRGKYALIEFWNSWSLPGREEASGLRSLHEELQAENRGQVLSISLDRERAMAQSTVLEYNLNWPTGCLGDVASERGATSLLGISTVPTLLVVDPNGKIVYRGRNYFDAMRTLKELLK